MSAFAHLLLRVGPAGDLNDHVQDGLLGIGVERDVVEGRDGMAVLLDEDAVLQGKRSAHLANGVAAGHGCGCRCGCCAVASLEWRG